MDRFVDNGDGTVTDNKTGLMWQQETVGKQRTWDEAVQYCENLNLAGYNDWRLPKIEELQSIIDYTRYDPAIDTSVFPDTMSLGYWSSTTATNYTSSAWLVSFYGGNVSNYYKSYVYYVRAVRKGGNNENHISI